MPWPPFSVHGSNYAAVRCSVTELMNLTMVETFGMGSLVVLVVLALVPSLAMAWLNIAKLGVSDSFVYRPSCL